MQKKLWFSETKHILFSTLAGLNEWLGNTESCWSLINTVKKKSILGRESLPSEVKSQVIWKQQFSKWICNISAHAKILWYNC